MDFAHGRPATGTGSGYGHSGYLPPIRAVLEAKFIRRGEDVVATLDRILGRAPSRRSREDEDIGAKVRASVIASARARPQGARRVWRDVLAEGVACKA